MNVSAAACAGEAVGEAVTVDVPDSVLLALAVEDKVVVADTLGVYVLVIVSVEVALTLLEGVDEGDCVTEGVGATVDV